jgi:BirA family biotin operon repressor/biotin-[acetyl-CoA-carboxylase] ligase
MTIQSEVIGSHLLFLDEVDSTSVKLQQMVRATSLAEGYTVRANFQSEGRGQMGSLWISSPHKNLLFSFALYPKFMMPERQFGLNVAISLGIFDVVDHYFPNKISLKWPNDIMLDGNKIGGILIQNSIQSDRIVNSIIGIGLNVNQDSFPPLLKNAGSFYIHSGKAFDLENIYQELITSLNIRYKEFKDGQEQEQRKFYQSKLFRLDEPNFYRLGDHFVEGVVRGVNNEGQLMLEIEGIMYFLNNKEVEFIY